MTTMNKMQKTAGQINLLVVSMLPGLIPNKIFTLYHIISIKKKKKILHLKVDCKIYAYWITIYLYI